MRPSGACWPGCGYRGRTQPSNGPMTASEFHLRRLLKLFALLDPDIKEILRRKPESACQQHGRELLDAGVVFLHGVVEETSCCGDLVFKIGELVLELLKVLVGLEVGIGFAQRKELAQRAGECVF